MVAAVQLVSRMIVVETDQLRKSAYGRIWGPIWLAYSELEAFPDEGWDDIVLPILTAWINALIGFSQRNTGSATVYFMDGPFRAALELSGTDVSIELLSDRFRDGESCGMFTSDLRWMLSNATAEGAKVLHELRVRGWDVGDDADALRSAVSYGRIAVRRLLKG